MKVSELLSEGISQIVYHYTNLRALTKLLSTDTFNLTADIGTGSEQDIRRKTKFYYLSTTRHKLGGYNLNPYRSGIMLKLDGKKLNQRYSGDPVDYWGEEFRKINPTKAEAEDRIFSKEPSIPNAKQYIMEVHILFDESKDISDMEISSLRKIAIDLKKSNIPYYIYSDSKNFLLQNKNKATTALPKDIGKSSPAVPGRQLKHDLRDFNVYLELYNKKPGDTLSVEAKKILYHLRIYFSDKLATFGNIMHNNKSKDADFVHKYLRILRREKLSSNKEFLDFILNKWDSYEFS